LLAETGLDVHLEETASLEPIDDHEDVLRIFRQEAQDLAEIERAREGVVAILSEKRDDLAGAIQREQAMA
jgi:hypothetical protein